MEGRPAFIGTIMAYQPARIASTTAATATGPDERTRAGSEGRRADGRAGSASVVIAVPGPQTVAHPVRKREKFRRLAQSSVRSAGRLQSITSMIRPGRGDMTTIRVDRKTASGIEWVTNSTVLRVWRQS